MTLVTNMLELQVWATTLAFLLGCFNGGGGGGERQFLSLTPSRLEDPDARRVNDTRVLISPNWESWSCYGFVLPLIFCPPIFSWNDRQENLLTDKGCLLPSKPERLFWDFLDWLDSGSSRMRQLKSRRNYGVVEIKRSVKGSAPHAHWQHGRAKDQLWENLGHTHSLYLMGAAWTPSSRAGRSWWLNQSWHTG